MTACLQKGSLIHVNRPARECAQRTASLCSRPQNSPMANNSGPTDIRKREKVSLNISIKDDKGNPVNGSFSVSITDRRSIQPDSLADNILSNLLLTSDLKGYVENPGYYVLQQDLRTLRTIDFLMMTHGWRRHHIRNVLTSPSLNLTNYMEKGQTISGRIKGFFGGNVKKRTYLYFSSQTEHRCHYYHRWERGIHRQYIIQRQHNFPRSGTYQKRIRRSRHRDRCSPISR